MADDSGRWKTPESGAGAAGALHPSWCEFIRYCQELGHGLIERLSIQDGLPLIAEMTTKKVKFARPTPVVKR